MSNSILKPKLAFILSLPRSGSTVLSAMLDRRHGIVSPPESSFPQVLGIITRKDRENPEWMAALYLESTFVPTPLSIEEAAACMIGDNESILINLGLAIAAKLERDPELVRAIVWKTPRTIGLHEGPMSTSGMFIVLRRNPHNVFESQFSVGFGENNRNPWRFAVFRESYEHAFSRLPAERRIDISYDDLPGALEPLCEFLGVERKGNWDSTRSSLDLAAENCYWMTSVTSEFVNRDPEKRSRLDHAQIQTLDRAMSFARPIRIFLGPVRKRYDWVSMNRIFSLARERINQISTRK